MDETGAYLERDKKPEVERALWKMLEQSKNNVSYSENEEDQQETTDNNKDTALASVKQEIFVKEEPWMNELYGGIKPELPVPDAKLKDVVPLFDQLKTRTGIGQKHDNDTDIKWSSNGKFLGKQEFQVGWEHEIKPHLDRDIPCGTDVVERGDVDQPFLSCDTSGPKEVDSIAKKNAHTERPHCCNICHESFKKKVDLKEHKKIHSGQKSFNCGFCGMSFTLNAALKKHIRYHKKKGTYNCDMCNRNLSGKGPIHKHIKTHLGLTMGKLYVCDICGKTFSANFKLEIHRRTHTGEKPYKCHLCKKAYADSSHLKEHIITHNEEMLYKCDICDKSFHFRYKLNSHRKTHEENKSFKCDKCSNVFTYKGDLNRHLKNHTSAYKCHICEKVFGRKDVLQRHMQSHTKAKPFVCDVCNKAFQRK